MLAVFAFVSVGCDRCLRTATKSEFAPGHYPPNTTQEAQPEFIRFLDHGDHSGQLETVITTYEGEAGEKVELIGAVHIGDTAYYESLEELFTSYESLLYELVKPEGAEPPSPDRQRESSRSLSAISLLQRGMQNGLGLDYQIDAIDYSAENFVHADLDAETFVTMSAERGQRMSQLFLRAMLDEFGKNLKGQSSVQVDPLLQFKLIGALFSKERTKRLKYLFGQQLALAGDALDSFGKGFGDGESVILIERNKKAIEVLRERLAAGEKHIGVFYGAAHLEDLEQRIFAEIGLQRTGVRWEPAWVIE